VDRAATLNVTDTLAATEGATIEMGGGSLIDVDGLFSIDGIRPDHLESIKEAGYLDEDRGLGWLFDRSFRTERAIPITTITSSSHVSTITCTTPARNGIVANSFLVDGSGTILTEQEKKILKHQY